MIEKLLNKIKERYIYFVLAIAIFAIDIISKYLIELYLQKIVVKNIIGDFLVFIYTKNYGVAFGFLNNINQSFSNIMPLLIKILVVFSICLIFNIILNTDTKKQRFSAIGFSLILGGALGNFFDRVFRGYVTDFINMGLTKELRFPYNYNVADASITIGIALVIIGIIFFKEDIDLNKKKNTTQKKLMSS